LISLVLAVVAAVFGFGGIAAGFGFVAKIAFFAFLSLFVLGLVAHLARRDVW
jgi:uncharacterized membrane protein YtjA (UPF0391 family)